MSHHEEVYVVMAGLIALTKYNRRPSQDLAIFVRDSGHDLRGRVYGFEDDNPEETLPLANHRVSFGWLDKNQRPMTAKPSYKRKKPQPGATLNDPPADEDEAEQLRVTNIRLATDRPTKVKIDPRCVNPDSTRGIKRIVAAQVLLDRGTLCSGHLLSIGGLVPQLYFRGKREPEDDGLRTCADVLVLKMLAPAKADYLQVKLNLLSKLGSSTAHEVCREFKLGDKSPIIVSLTNQSRPVSEIPRLAGHFRKYRHLLAKVTPSSRSKRHQEPYRPRVYIPRLRGGKFSLAQPGFDFDGVDGLTPPSVQNRALCPFTDIPE